MSRKTGVILSYVLMIFEILSTLFLTPFIIRNLGQTEYGVYKLVSSVSTYLLLLDMGVGNAIVRYVAKFRANGEMDQERRFFGIAQVYYILISFVACICGAVLISHFPSVFSSGLTNSEIELAQKLLWIFVINIAVTLSTAAAHYIVIGRGLFAVSRIAAIIQIILRISLTFAALCFGFRSVAIVAISTAITVLGRGGIVAYVLLKLKLRPQLEGINSGFVKEIIGYSSWILVQMIATQINACADQVLLGAMVPGAAAIIAIYGVGAQISQYYQTIGSAFGNVLMPGVVSLVEENAGPKVLQNEMVRIGRIVLLVLLAILGGFYLYGSQFVELWAGKDYSDGYYVALMLMFAHMLILAESIGTQILWAKNEHKEQAILKLAVVGINIVLTIMLIRWNALIGATVGTVISLLCGDVVVMNFVFHKKIGIDLKEYYSGLFRGILPVFFISVVINIPVSWFGLTGWGGLCCNVAVYCVVYGVLALLVGMNQYEKELVSSLLKTRLVNRR